MYPNHPEFKIFFHRRSKTIDYALALPNIADRVSNFVYEPFFYRFNGNHRAFFFDISEKVLFGNRKISLLDPSGRGFSSKDVKNTKVYLEQFHYYLFGCNVFNRIERILRSRFHDHREAERIDKVLTEAGISGENACRRRQRYYWSIDLHITKRELSLWCTL